MDNLVMTFQSRMVKRCKLHRGYFFITALRDCIHWRQTVRGPFFCPLIQLSRMLWVYVQWVRFYLQNILDFNAYLTTLKHGSMIFRPMQVPPIKFALSSSPTMQVRQWCKFYLLKLFSSLMVLFILSALLRYYLERFFQSNLFFQHIT